jgi:hypothetical protein
MSVSSRQRPPSVPSSTSLHHTSSVRSNVIDGIPPPVSIVITTPRKLYHVLLTRYNRLTSGLTAWARDEPPSPKDHSSTADRNLATEFRPSDVPSYNNSVADLNHSRWWTFTLPRPTRQPPTLPELSSPSTVKPERKSFRDISWLHASSSMREGTSFIRREKDLEAAQATSSHNRDRGLFITLPTAPTAPYTLSHNTTPGWDSPWSPRTAVQGPERLPIDDNPYSLGEDHSDLYESQRTTSVRRVRKKNFRTFILTNPYVPLVGFCVIFDSLSNLLHPVVVLSIH